MSTLQEAFDLASERIDEIALLYSESEKNNCQNFLTKEYIDCSYYYHCLKQASLIKSVIVNQYCSSEGKNLFDDVELDVIVDKEAEFSDAYAITNSGGVVEVHITTGMLLSIDLMSFIFLSYLTVDEFSLQETDNFLQKYHSRFKDI
jgi:hypothetical protein